MATMTRGAWIFHADNIVSKRNKRKFPPVDALGRLDPRIVTDGFEAHRVLLGMRKVSGYEEDEILAQGEHYTFARAMVILGSLPMYIVMLDAAFAYHKLKEKLAEMGKLKWAGLVSGSLDGKVTPTSPGQLKAGVDGAKAGLWIGSPLTASLILG